MIKLLIIDGFNLIRRIHSAVPGDENTDKHAAGVVQSIGASVARAIKKQQPTHAVCVLESNASTWRHAIYDAYKQGRKPQPTALLDNLPNIIEALQQQHVAQVSVELAEADDVIASIANKFEGSANQCLILSTDHLLAQLLSNNTRQYDHFGGAPIDHLFIQQRYGISTAQMVDYFSLCGSSSLNIPGVAGVGSKTAAKLMNEYGDLESVLDNIDKLKGKLKEQIIKSADLLALYKRLFTLERNIHLNNNLKQWRLN
ncbi:MAG: protein Xni [Saprospiraceae bacterium]